MNPNMPAQSPEAMHRLLKKGFRWCSRVDGPGFWPTRQWIRQPGHLLLVDRWCRPERDTVGELATVCYNAHLLVYERDGSVFVDGAWWSDYC